MLYLFRLLLLLINIDQETVLNWFGIENSINQDFNKSNFETSTNVSLTTFRLILESLWKDVQDGLSLGDIESILFFILFIRFVILAIRYNLKTSFYITCIGLFAGFLWYRHLVDFIFMYRLLLLKIPFLHKLGPNLTNLRNIKMNISIDKQMDSSSDLTSNLTQTFKGTFQREFTHDLKRVAKTDLLLKDNVHWYNIGKILYSAIQKSIVAGISNSEDSFYGTSYYIDPISMILAKLPESIKLKIIPIHYQIYHYIIPRVCSVFGKFWNQLSGVASYALITRIGKKYCPYLVRWHWTFLVLLGIVEPFFLHFLYRVCYFQGAILRPQIRVKFPEIADPAIVLQSNVLSIVISSIILAHIGFIIFGLFHAIWGQYFYFPFFVENTELHTGLRPTDSVYSGGQTSWQNKDEKEKNFNRFFPKVWYGWFGRGTKKNDLQFTTNIRKFLKKMIKKLRRQSQR